MPPSLVVRPPGLPRRDRQVDVCPQVPSLLGTLGTRILAGTNGQLSVMAGANGRLQRGTFPPVVVFFVPNSAAFSPAELSACLPFSVPSCFPVRITPSHTQPLGVAAQYCPVRMKYIYIPRKVDPSGPKVCYTASHLRVVRPAYYEAHRSRANCLPGSLASESEVPLVPVSTSPVPSLPCQLA